MEPGDLQPELLKRRITHVLGAGHFERVPFSLLRYEDRVLLGANSDSDYCGYSYAGLSRHQGRNGLVLDLLDATHGSTSGRIAVREQLPVPRKPLRVLSVSSEYAYLERPSVSRLAVVLGAADPLVLADPKAVHLDSE